NPLAPILTVLEIMRLRAGGTLERERTILERQGHHLVRLGDDLFDGSRITPGELELTRAPGAGAELVTEGVEMASPVLEQRQHHVSVHVDPALFVEGDSGRLAQVISNLLNNAAKYTEKQGHIDIAGARAGGEAVIKIRDSGIGIAPEMLPRIFDLFVQ